MKKIRKVYQNEGMNVTFGTDFYNKKDNILT